MDVNCAVCTIGGGSGMPVINKALVKAGCQRIYSIVTTFDSGGHTGRQRTDERGRILAFSDYWRSLISLWEDTDYKERWEEMLRFRDGRGRNFGNVFFQFMSEKAGDLSHVDSLFAELTGANLHGEVIPVSLEPADICFSTMTGKVYRGEHYLDQLRMSRDRVTRIWLEPEVSANPEAIRALETADLVLICPGSMYGSILINFLPRGMVEAYRKSKALKILFTNIMSVANENDNYDQNAYVRMFSRYLGTNKPFDLVVMPDLDQLDPVLLNETLRYYQLENSFPIQYNPVSEVRTVVADIATIEQKNMRLRHCEEKVASFIQTLSL